MNDRKSTWCFTLNVVFLLSVLKTPTISVFVQARSYLHDVPIQCYGCFCKRNIECRFTLKRVRDMMKTYSQMHRTDKDSQHSSII